MAIGVRTISMQLPAELVQRIDNNALATNGGNRTQYILSYLPETYEPTSETPAKPAANDRR